MILPLSCVATLYQLKKEIGLHHTECPCISARKNSVRYKHRSVEKGENLGLNNFFWAVLVNINPGTLGSATVSLLLLLLFELSQNGSYLRVLR